MTNLRSKIGSKSHKNEYVEKITGFDSKQFEGFYCYATFKNTSVSIKSKQYRFVWDHWYDMWHNAFVKLLSKNHFMNML